MIALLAVTFGSPALLWGLALGAVPIIVHLLHKRKFRETSWAAMQFLLEAARKNSRRIRLEQLILLAVRVLILLLLALALSQPFVESAAFQVSATVPTHRILVIDASFSMGHQPAESSRFEKAQSVAKQIVSSAQRGDAFNLVRIADSLPAVIVEEPSHRKSEMLSEIEDLRLTDERGDLAATLPALAELLRKAPELQHKEIFILSDFQRESWAAESATLRSQLATQLKSLAGEARLMLIDFGQDPAPNAAVTEFTTQDLPAAVNRPVRLQVTVGKFDGIGPSERTLELFVDDRFAGRQRIELPPNAELQTDFSYTFNTPGEHQLEVRLDGDSLAADDRRWLALPVREALRVLLVNGKPAGRPSQQATYYLEQALSPTDSYAEREDLIQTRVIGDGELTGTDLNEFDCVFLCDVAMFTGREAGLLETYAKNGGGVVVSLGNQVNADNYNRFLYRDGEGVLPVRLKDRVGDPDNPTEAFGFALDDFSHPIINPFEGNPNTGLDRTLTLAYFAVDEPEGGLQRTVLRFESGDPAVIEAPSGRGKTVLVTTSLDDRWNTWTTLGGASFVPVIHEIVKFAVTGRWRERRRLLGEPISRALPAGTFDAAVTMKTPDGRKSPVRISTQGQPARISFEETHSRGMYELQLAAPFNRTEFFAVNVDPRESRLAKIGEEELKSELLAGVDFAYRTQWQDIHRDMETEATRGGSLTQWLLLATLCLIFVELLMAWRFAYGFVLLYVFVAAAFVRYAFSWNVLGGLLLMLLLLVAGLAIVLTAARRNDNRGTTISFR